MDNLSNPVAFTSAPLNEYDNPTPAWTQQKSSTTANMDEDDDQLASKMMESYFFVPDPQQHQNGSESSK